MPNMNAEVFKRWTTIQLYAQTNLVKTENDCKLQKVAISPVLVVGFKKIILRSYVELPGQAENARVEQFIVRSMGFGRVSFQ